MILTNTNCHNLPYDGCTGKKPKDLLPKRVKCMGVATNVYSRKTLEKPKRGMQIFENKGSGVVNA